MKPAYHQSNMKHLFECPKRFALSMTEKANIPESTIKLMNEGSIAEIHAFEGMEGAKRFEGTDEYKALCKGRTPDTIAGIVEIGKQIGQHFARDGKSFIRFSIDCGEYFYNGEIDYVGGVLYRGEWVRCLADCKLTGDIPKLWDQKRYKYEFLQSISYTWAWWKKTGERLPFVYVVGENKLLNGEAIVKKYMIEPQDKDFIWFEKQLEECHKVNTDAFHFANTGNRTCGNEGFANGRCWFLHCCDEGRYFLTEEKDVDFSKLQESANV